MKIKVNIFSVLISLIVILAGAGYLWSSLLKLNIELRIIIIAVYLCVVLILQNTLKKEI